MKMFLRALSNQLTVIFTIFAVLKSAKLISWNWKVICIPIYVQILISVVMLLTL